MARVIKLKKEISDITVSLAALSLDEPVQRRFKLKKLLAVPPKPPHGIATSVAGEAFEAIREYYANRDEPVPQEEIKWYQEELIAEKKQYDEFWDRCCVTRAIMESVMRGDDEIAMMKVELAARASEKKQPIRPEDIGPMPPHGTPEFWSWCRKRKLLKAQQDAAIIAAGGTVKATKPKKPKKTI
jgi:hypothetical protein